MFGLPFHSKDGQIQSLYVVSSHLCVACVNFDDVASVSLEQLKIGRYVIAFVT